MNMPPSPPSNEPWKPKIERIYKKREKEPIDDQFLSDLYKTGDGNPPEFETTEHNDSIPYIDEAYITRDGNLRYYHNPKIGHYSITGDEKVSYSFGATKCPHSNLEDIRTKTVVPESLGETDFFTNYVNTLVETDTILVDPNTGNRYYNYREYYPNITGVNYEGENHFNIQRFLIDPHYKNFNLNKDEARLNALHDVYKYFLFQENGQREKAWEEANRFMSENVDPLIESKYAKWANENNKILVGSGGVSDPNKFVYSPNLFNSNDYTFLPQFVIDHNRRVIEGDEQGRIFSKQEIIDVLVDYNIHFRKKDPEEALRISVNSVNEIEEKYKTRIAEVEQRPLTEYKVIKEASHPEGYDAWPPENQDEWRSNNPDKLGEYQEKFTEEMRQRELRSLRNCRFADE